MIWAWTLASLTGLTLVVPWWGACMMWILVAAGCAMHRVLAREAREEKTADRLEADLRASLWAEMTDAQREEQRRSFAYGNARLSNPSVTRAMVDRAADELEPPDQGPYRTNAMPECTRCRDLETRLREAEHELQSIARMMKEADQKAGRS